MAGETKEIWKNYLNFDIEETGLPICREERQYALLLYVVLDSFRKGRKLENEKLNTYYGIPIDSKILQVTYEAAYMRDFFEKDLLEAMKQLYLEEKKKNPRLKGYNKNSKIYYDHKFDRLSDQNSRRFNKCLLDYIQEIFKENKKIDIENIFMNVNLGTAAGVDNMNKAGMEDIAQVVKEMMNSKPDLSVIYEKDGQTYLQFYECKYLSSESVNDSGDKQLVTQDRIADFLQGYFGVQKCRTKLIQFVANEDTKRMNDREIHINITDLMSIYNSI